MKEAVKLLAKHENLEVTSTYTDYYGNVYKSEIAIKGDKLPYGAAIEVQNGRIVIKGDFYRAKITQDELVQLVKQYYTAAATVAALRAMGYRSFKIQKAKEKIYVEAV